MNILNFITVAFVITIFIYFNEQFKEKKELRKKQEFEQNRLKEERADLERRRQIEEAQKQKALKEKYEIERKRLSEQRADLEIKRQIEETQRQNALKEKLELEQKRLKEQRAELERKRKIEEAQKQKVLLESIVREFQKNKFTINNNNYLKKDITAFYHDNYHSGGNWKVESTVENMIWTLKNDSSPFPSRLPRARQQLENILLTDLPLILCSTNFNSLTICVVPRAKKESYYRHDQLYFHKSVNNVLSKLDGFYNGTNYIKRHTNTRTTHLREEENGDERSPYIGITKNTCTILNDVKNKDILLIDDIYTKSVNIDEDAIQALFDHGANSVIFYAIGKTVSKFY